MNCVNCYQEIPEGSKFCPHCGAKQPEPGCVNEQNNRQESTGQTVQNENTYAENGNQQYYQQSQVYQGQYDNGYQEPTVNWVPYLILSIISTVCCCLPFGIVGIVYAAKINTAVNTGDIEGANRAARLAKIWIIVSVVVGVIVNGLMMVVSAGISSYYPY